MSLYSQFKMDDNLEKSGIVLQYGNAKNGKPVEIRIARAGGANTQYSKRMEILVKPYRRQIQNETIEDALIDGVLKQVYAETVVLGWDNVEDETGKLMEFNVKNCIKLFNDLPELFKDIQDQAQRAALFRAEIRDNDVKN